MKKGGGANFIISVDIRPTGLCGGIHISKNLRTHVGEDPRTSQVWKIEQDNCPKVNKDPEGLSYISDLNHLFTALVLIREDARTLSLSLGMDVCIASDLLRSFALGRMPIPFLSGCVFLPWFCLT